MNESPPSIPADPDPRAFEPVPLASTRHDGWTPARQRGFIDLLAIHGGVAAAARGVGMSARTAYRLRDRPGGEGFAAAWDAALDEGRARSFDAALDAGLNGVPVPVFYRGKQVGVRRRPDNRLLFAACYGQPMRSDY